MKKFLAGLLVKVLIIVAAIGAVVVVNGKTLQGSDDFAGLITKTYGRVESFAEKFSERPNGVEKVIEAKVEVAPPTQAELAAATTHEPPKIPSHCRLPGPGSNAVVVGDNIQIRFFETDLGALRNGRGTGHKAAFERLDLSGSYEVGPDGAISMPLLGRIKVLGHRLSCVEPIIAQAAFDYSPNEVNISATFNRRPAVTALGQLRAPGRYDYLPGMTVEQLLSLAGAVVDETTGPLPVANAPYLEARQVELEAALTSNQLKIERIKSAMNGKDQLSLSNEQLRAAEEILGAQRIEAEKFALAASIAAQNSSLQQLQSEKAQVEQMLAEQRKKLTLVEYQLGRLTQRHEDLKNLRRRGVVQESTVSASESSKMDMQRTVLETKSALLELESRSLRLNSELDARTTNFMQQLAGELRNVSEEANGLQSQLQTVNMQLKPKQSAQSNTYLAVMIERAGARGAKQFEAFPETIILPGDVVTTVMKKGLSRERYALSTPEDLLKEKADK